MMLLLFGVTKTSHLPASNLPPRRWLCWPKMVFTSTIFHGGFNMFPYHQVGGWVVAGGGVVVIVLLVGHRDTLGPQLY